jgi:tetratricopeptide (TPR) repeat protein
MLRPRLVLGRENELRDLVAALLWLSPSPIPVVGPAGVGRSTLVLEALHDARVDERFGARRYFVRCDGVRSRDALLIAIGRALGLEPWDLEDRLFAELERGPAAVALSGLDEPWRADRCVEALLARLGRVPGLALVATLPEAPLPLPPWRSPLRIDPFGRAAARETFLRVAGERFRDDPLLHGLLDSVDLLPLAVVLLAHAAAQGESDLQGLWRRWQEWRERRSSRLRWKGAQEWELHVEVPLEVALARVKPAARRLLSLLANLPDGLRAGDLDLLLPGEGEAAACCLKTAGFAFEESGRLMVLPPIRKAVRREHPPLAADLDRAVDLYLARGAAAEWREEPGNVHSMILLALDGPDPEPAIRSAIGLADLFRSLGWGSGRSSELQRARDVAQELERHDLAALCAGMLAQLARSRCDPESARERWEEALRHYRHAGDVQGEALCLHSLGDLALDGSDPDTARIRFEDALPLFRMIRDPRGEARCLRRMADAEAESHHMETARRLYQEALPVYRRIRDSVGEANCLRGEADVALEDGETDYASYSSGF